MCHTAHLKQSQVAQLKINEQSQAARHGAECEANLSTTPAKVLNTGNLTLSSSKVIKVKETTSLAGRGHNQMRPKCYSVC